MATTTTRLALTKPSTTDNVDIAVLNANTDKLDAAAGSFVCTSSTRPATPYNGQIIFETNTLNQYVWVAGTGTWVRLGGTPAGSVVSLASATIPTGWLLCDGTSYQTSVYPDLAAVMNYAYGGSGAAFNVPDLRGRVAVGVGTVTDQNSRTQAFSLAGKSGAKDHALTNAQMPRHTHTQDQHRHGITIRTNASGFGDWAIGYVNNTGGVVGVTSDYATAVNQHTGGTGTSQAASDGDWHNNLQPYLVLNYIIKT